MIGVPSDTREPAMNQAARATHRSWRWGLALAVCGLMWCAVPPAGWRSVALAQPDDESQGSADDTKSSKPRSPFEPKENPEPWETLTTPRDLASDAPIAA